MAAVTAAGSSNSAPHGMMEWKKIEPLFDQMISTGAQTMSCSAISLYLRGPYRYNVGSCKCIDASHEHSYNYLEARSMTAATSASPSPGQQHPIAGGSVFSLSGNASPRQQITRFCRAPTSHLRSREHHSGGKAYHA